LQQIPETAAQRPKPVKLIADLGAGRPQTGGNVTILTRPLQIGFHAVDPTLRLPVVAKVGTTQPTIDIGRAARGCTWTRDRHIRNQRLSGLAEGPKHPCPLRRGDVHVRRGTTPKL